MNVPLSLYIDIEQALMKRLLEAWRPYAAEAFVAINAAMVAKEWDKARDLAGRVDLAEIGAANKEWIKANLYTAAKFGASLSNTNYPLALTVGQYDNLLNRIYRVFGMYLSYAGTTRVYERIIQSITDAEAESRKAEKAEVETATPRYVKEFVSFAAEGDRALKLISSLHTSRLAAWGFTAEAEVMGYERYQLVAVLDNRTSEFCRMIDGRTFEVAAARKKLDEVLSAQDPEDLRTLQPWPKQDQKSIGEFMEMGEDELAAEGLMIPPFHPHCRTILAKIGKDYRITKPTENVEEGDTTIVAEGGEDGFVEFDPLLDTSEFVEPVTTTSLAEYGVEATEQEVAYWNDYVGVSPALMFNLMADVSPQELFDEMVPSVDIDSQAGPITMGLKGPLAGEDTDVEVSQVLDPQTGVLYQNYIDFADTDSENALDFVGTVYAGLVDSAEQLAASALGVKANGTVMAHARFGFLPSQQAWDGVRKDILADMAAGGGLSTVLDELPGYTVDVVETLLKSPDPKALWALASMTDTIEGEPVAAVLFAGYTLDMALSLNDADALARYKAYFP